MARVKADAGWGDIGKDTEDEVVPVKAKAPVGELVTVTAVGNFQIAHEGQVAGPGESLTVPVAVADRWVAAGIASR